LLLLLTFKAQIPFLAGMNTMGEIRTFFAAEVSKILALFSMAAKFQSSFIPSLFYLVYHVTD
jgi:hypothetical protein